VRSSASSTHEGGDAARSRCGTPPGSAWGRVGLPRSVGRAEGERVVPCVGPSGFLVTGSPRPGGSARTFPLDTACPLLDIVPCLDMCCTGSTLSDDGWARWRDSDSYGETLGAVVRRFKTSYRRKPRSLPLERAYSILIWVIPGQLEQLIATSRMN
jgi:hypothetical protein